MRSKAYYTDYMLNDIHAHAGALRISLAWGTDKVNLGYRDAKERESTRIY